ncbi:MAG: EAL domain-containing protein [Betaproteobacteria bacterium]|nr:MAG: EAL domain-containing protein [Betaproteobacteria bacterium]
MKQPTHFARQRKQADELLRGSEERFRSLVELSSDWYWEQDAQFRFTWLAGRDFGDGPMGDPARWIGKTHWETGAEPLERTWENHSKVLESRQPFYDFELRLLDKSGQEVYLSVNGVPVFHATGAFKGYRGVSRRITNRKQRKRAEQLLRLEHTVARAVTEADSASAALKAVIRAVCEAQDWECGRFFRVDDEAGVLRFAESWNKPGPQFDLYIERSREVVYTPGVGLAGMVWQSGAPMWVADITRDPRVSQKGIAIEADMHGAFVFPVNSGGKIIGVLAFNSREIREPDERLLQAIHVIGSQIGQFVQRKQAEEALRKSNERFDIAVRATNDVIRDWDLVTNELWWNENFTKVFGPPREKPDGSVKSWYESIHPDDQGRVIAGVHLLIGAGGENWSDEYRFGRHDGSFAYVLDRGYVIRDGAGQAIRMIGAMADISSRKQAEERIHDQALQQRLIAEFGQQAFASTDLEDVLSRAVELVSVTLKADYCNVLELEPDGKQLVIKAACGWPGEFKGRRTVPVRPGSRVELVLSRREPLVIEDLGADPRFSDSPLLNVGVRSGIQVPVLGTAGTFGILSAHARQTRRFTPEDVSFLQSVANILAVAIERKSAEERLAYLARFDALTGLPNRYLFYDRLLQTMAQARRSGQPMAVLFIDLDRFKLVNDTQGHGAGDRLLKEAAARLSQCVRGGDTVGRFGGDEFGAIVSDLSRPGDAGVVAQKVLEAIAHPFKLDEHETFVSASVGIALFPADGDDPEALVTNADTAMYRAKEQGRNTYQYFTREMNERALARVQMEAALRRAIERREFLLHYQPKVDLESRLICGFEALLRWQHPEKGLVQPGEFVSVLEDSGLIVQVGDWVMREVCGQIRVWQGAGLAVKPVTVNVSARQFQQKDFEAVVRRILGKARVDPSLVQFELTESLLMSDPESAARTLRDLRDSGARISVDDFGTGYSSLAYLKRFPIDALKIDHSFIRDITTDPEDAMITLAIIALAHSLKLKVVAEGVETREQLELLAANGCDEVQGYHFSAPTTAEECAKMLRENRRFA